jgi:hypothetical protein
MTNFAPIQCEPGALLSWGVLYSDHVRVRNLRGGKMGGKFDYLK